MKRIIENQTHLALILGITASASQVACQPEVALAPRNEVQAVEIADLPLEEEQALLNNKLFLYPADFKPEAFKDLSSSARAMDEAEREIYRNRRRMRDIQKNFTDEQIGDTARTRRKELKDAIRQIEIDLAAKQAELDAELAKPIEEQNASKIRRLTRSRDTFQANLEASRSSLEEFKASRGNKAMDAHDELDTLEEQVKSLDPKYQEAFDKVGSLVTWYDDMPDRFSFKPMADGSLQVSVTNWSPILKNSARAMSFSTTDGTITDATYENKGGRIRFTLHVPQLCTDKLDAESGAVVSTECQDAQDIEFKINRTRYSDTQNTDDGRLFYIGDLIVKNPVTGDTLAKGSAKLVDKQN